MILALIIAFVGLSVGNDKIVVVDPPEPDAASPMLVLELVQFIVDALPEIFEVNTISPEVTPSHLLRGDKPNKFVVGIGFTIT